MKHKGAGYPTLILLLRTYPSFWTEWLIGPLEVHTNWTILPFYFRTSVEVQVVLPTVLGLVHIWKPGIKRSSPQLDFGFWHLEYQSSMSTKHNLYRRFLPHLLHRYTLDIQRTRDSQTNLWALTSSVLYHALAHVTHVTVVFWHVTWLQRSINFCQSSSIFLSLKFNTDGHQHQHVSKSVSLEVYKT